MWELLQYEALDSVWWSAEPSCRFDPDFRSGFVQHDGAAYQLNAISKNQPENQDNEKKAPYAAAHSRSAIVISTSASQQQQHDQNDQDQTHR